MGNFSFYNKHTKAPKVQFTGVFDFKKIYQAVLGMYSDKAYLMTEKKNIQKAGGGGVEVEIELYGYRNETEYVQYELSVFIHSFDMNDVEIMVDGKKKIIQKGRIVIDFEGGMKTDYTDELEKTTFLKKMKKLYESKLMGDTLAVIYADKFEVELYKFHAAVKESLELYSAYNAF